MTPVVAQAQNLTSFDQAFIRMVDAALGSPLLALAAVGIAVAVGAVHALTPGHGKTIAAAYLVGGRGTLRDAVLLGVIVAGMHTLSVVVLAYALHLLLGGGGDVDLLARATPVLRVVSGVVVTAIGLMLLLGQWRRRRSPSHAHLPADVSPFSRRGIVALGLAGGLLPSPSAFLVLVTTSFSGRTGLGLLLVLAFSLGLAGTLIAVGIAAVRGREAVLRRMTVSPRLLRGLTLGGALVVLLGGIVLTATGLARL